MTHDDIVPLNTESSIYMRKTLPVLRYFGGHGSTLTRRGVRWARQCTRHPAWSTGSRLFSARGENLGHKTATGHKTCFYFCRYSVTTGDLWRAHAVFHVLLGVEAGGDLLSVAANSSYRAWANTFTTKECDDLRSQWNFFFAYWAKEESRAEYWMRSQTTADKYSVYNQYVLCLHRPHLCRFFYTFWWQFHSVSHDGRKAGVCSAGRSPAAWPRRRTDPGCSWADSSRCEHRSARRSSLRPSEDAACCRRRPAEAPLQTTPVVSFPLNAPRCTANTLLA